MTIVVSGLAADTSPVEFVERKGVGHPDTICDALAENLSRNLCRHYLDRFGTILHHNVDKALLCGGRAAPAFGGGEVLAPAQVYLCGRAVDSVDGRTVPVAEMLVEGSRAWFRRNLHAFDAERHVSLHNLVRPGSASLTQLFRRKGGGVPLANDTSFGIGYAPLSALERLVLEVDRLLNSFSRQSQHAACGEDTKVMGLRQGDRVSITVACAVIGRYVPDLDAYVAETTAIRDAVMELAARCGFGDCRVRVNAADDLDNGSVHLTVTGTSAEAGDDGEVGRGNRVNGLITPLRPMSLEAAAGKNPVSHVGKIYNVLAREIAEAIVSQLPDVAAAHCHILSEIGQPITQPAMTHVRLTTRDGSPVASHERKVEDIVAGNLDGAPTLVQRFVEGTIDVF